MCVCVTDIGEAPASLRTRVASTISVLAAGWISVSSGPVWELPLDLVNVLDASFGLANSVGLSYQTYLSNTSSNSRLGDQL